DDVRRERGEAFANARQSILPRAEAIPDVEANDAQRRLAHAIKLNDFPTLARDEIGEWLYARFHVEGFTSSADSTSRRRRDGDGERADDGRMRHHGERSELGLL